MITVLCDFCHLLAEKWHGFRLAHPTLSLPLLQLRTDGVHKEWVQVGNNGRHLKKFLILYLWIELLHDCFQKLKTENWFVKHFRLFKTKNTVCEITVKKTINLYVIVIQCLWLGLNIVTPVHISRPLCWMMRGYLF